MSSGLQISGGSGWLSRPGAGINDRVGDIATRVIAGATGSTGVSIPKLHAALADVATRDPDLARRAGDEVASRLGPVDAGNFLGGLFEKIEAVIQKAIHVAQAEGAKGVDGKPPTSATDLATPKTPAAAPKTVVFAKGNQAIFNDQWSKSFPGGKSQEQGGTLVYDRKTGVISVQNIGGNGSTSGSFSPNTVLKNPDRYAVLGVFHTHPYDKSEGGYTGISLSGGDAAYMIDSGQRVIVAQSGDKQFMYMRTDKTPKHVDFDKLNNHQNDRISDLIGKGYSFAAAASKAASETATKYGLAYYEGQNGKLSRVNP